MTAPLLNTIQQGTMVYTYKGIPTCKNPFDWALYPLLLWETQPRTIIEVGSYRGGSALWLADTMRSFGLPANVHSIDIDPITAVQDPGITFHQGDAEHLERCLSPDFMKALPRPLLIIEDSSHFMETTLAVLKFFDYWLERGEYIIIEDGIVNELGLDEAYRGGPRAAIDAFLAEHGQYEIDTRYCDWFGRNVTYAVNGFLRRRA